MLHNLSDRDRGKTDACDDEVVRDRVGASGYVAVASILCLAEELGEGVES